MLAALPALSKILLDTGLTVTVSLPSGVPDNVRLNVYVLLLLEIPLNELVNVALPPLTPIVKSPVTRLPEPVEVAYTDSEKITVRVRLLLEIAVLVIVGGVVSITIFLLALKEPVAPGDGSVKVASLPALSRIVPLLSSRELVAL